LFERVRDIPYGYPASRDPAEVLRKRCGSCSGKHYLLGEMFRMLGVPFRHMIGTHRFNESPLVFPGPMQEMLRKNEIVDLHDYLQSPWRIRGSTSTPPGSAACGSSVSRSMKTGTARAPWC